MGQGRIINKIKWIVLETNGNISFSKQSSGRFSSIHRVDWGYRAAAG